MEHVARPDAQGELVMAGMMGPKGAGTTGLERVHLAWTVCRVRNYDCQRRGVHIREEQGMRDAVNGGVGACSGSEIRHCAVSARCGQGDQR